MRKNIYFVSYNYIKECNSRTDSGFGNIRIESKVPIVTYVGILAMADVIKKNNQFSSVIILNFIRLES